MRISSGRLSKEESGKTGDGSEDGGAGKASSTGLSRGLLRRGRLGDGLVASRGRSDNGRADGLSHGRRAGDLDGLGLDGGDGGDVLLGDVSGGVAGALRLLRLLGSLRLLRGLGLLGGLRLLGSLGVLRLLGDGAVAVRRGSDGVLGGRTDGADGGRDGDGLSHDNGGVSRAVGDISTAVDDGVDLLLVDGGGGHGLLRGLRGGGLAGAVRDIRATVDDRVDGGGSDDLSDGGGLGVGHGRGGDDSSSSETHLD